MNGADLGCNYHATINEKTETEGQDGETDHNFRIDEKGKLGKSAQL